MRPQTSESSMPTAYSQRSLLCLCPPQCPAICPPGPAGAPGMPGFKVNTTLGRVLSYFFGYMLLTLSEKIQTNHGNLGLCNVLHRVTQGTKETGESQEKTEKRWVYDLFIISRILNVFSRCAYLCIIWCSVSRVTLAHPAHLVFLGL